MSHQATRTELLDILEGLEGEADALRAKRAILTYRLGRVLREKERVKRHLAVLDRGEEAAC